MGTDTEKVLDAATGSLPEAESHVAAIDRIRKGVTGPAKVLLDKAHELLSAG